MTTVCAASAIVTQGPIAVGAIATQWRRETVAWRRETVKRRREAVI